MGMVLETEEGPVRQLVSSSLSAMARSQSGEISTIYLQNECWN